ncbi:MAG: O-acetyl-ADP-ribose deacetylase [Clostridia bacterium]|nr:O-acetyl-ADP-ribose deacetylase [Clostridia bacterium]
MPFEMVRNDITKMRVDAIVNAANRSLLGGGGVDGAIHCAAGPKLLEECMTLGGCETGQAKITRGYDLPARYVIHTVGPIWCGGEYGERGLLASCYRNSLALALEHGCETVAFPLISAGAYGYPKDQALEVAVGEISRFLLEHDMTVYLVLFGHTEFLTGKKLFRDVQEYIDDVYADTHINHNIEARRKAQWQRGDAAGLALDRELMEAAPKQEDAFAEACMLPKYDAAPCPAPAKKAAKPTKPNWLEMFKKTDAGFSETLKRMIDKKGMTDTQCYKRANVDRKLFSKIRSNPGYRPSKPTVFAFAVALELSLPETRNLLDKAGYSLTHSSKFDIVLEYFIKNRIYDIYEINEVLFQFDMPLLGSSMN